MKPELSTVCIATEETKRKGYSPPEGFTGKMGVFFTTEQFNQFVSDLIKDTLKTAAENADLIETDGDVDPNSITNQFENIFEKYKV